MSGIRKLEHVYLGVSDTEAASTFYESVMGLTRLSKQDGIVYFACGRDDRFDLAVTDQTSGVERFAVRVDDATVLNRYEVRLQDAGHETSRPRETPASIREALRFTLPSGITIELVTLDEKNYHRTRDTGISGRGGHAPIDLDHITLRTDAIREDVEFLQEMVDFKVSDVALDEAGEWRGVWTRHEAYHHDVAFKRTDDPKETLDHLAWTMSSIDHMKLFLDKLADEGHQIEVGINRHFIGNNLFSYFLEPGGNRFELTAEVPTVDAGTERTIHEPTVDTFSAWGGVNYPETFVDGS